MRKAIVLSIALVSALGVPNSAVAGGVDCDTNRVCIYDGNGFVGIIGERAPGGGIVNVSGAFNDKMDSWENKTATDAAWYYNSNGDGNCREMDSGTEDGNVNFLNSDELTSWKTNGGC